MSSYFDRVEQQLGDAVERRAHRPWYVRLLTVSRTRTLAVVLAALVIATPSVGVATDWFGIGAPDHFAQGSPTLGAGRALPGKSVMLPLRFPDPQGGPPWGMRLVQTTRGDTCMQFGRVEDGKVGELGIDGAWNNDRQFHPFPSTFDGGWGQSCGTTDAAGHAFVNVEFNGIASSANLVTGTRGPQGEGCITPQYVPSRLARRLRHPFHPQTGSNLPSCPPGAGRIVFIGLLGPDASSITYRAANGTLRTEQTSGSDGAYLLVFPLNQKTCNLYSQSLDSGLFSGSGGNCGDSVQSSGDSASPVSPGAVTAIRYRDGHVCSLEPSRALTRQYHAFITAFNASHHIHGPLSQAQQVALRAAAQTFIASHHLTPTRFIDQLDGRCPPVGYVAPKRHITAAQVATPITVRIVPTTQYGPRVDISFTARQPVKSSSSWYEESITNPPGCPSSGSNGPINLGNVHAGQLIHDDRFLSIPPCKGTYHGIIGYMQNSTPTSVEGSGGGIPGKDGAVVVGRFHFTIR